jgi:arylsulfatase A-like enzyme
LRQHGYRTALIGTQHIAGNAEEQDAAGYDEKLPESDDQAERWLAARPREPFFLDVGFNETHRHGTGFHPLLPGQTPTDPRFVRPAPTVPDTPATRADMAAFIDSAGRLDAKMGAVLHALDRHGFADNTLVICTTDHGIAFPGMKCHLTDHGLGVMLIVRGPGFTGGRVVDEMVSHVDVFPTVCATLGLPTPAWLQGQSLWEPRDEIFAEVNCHAAYEPQRAVRTKRYKLIRRFDGRTRPVLPNTDDSPSKDVWLAAGPRVLPAALYDLAADPQEINPLTGHEDVRAEMHGRLERWMAATDDPLLRGPIPLPAGARINDPDGSSPNEPLRTT